MATFNDFNSFFREYKTYRDAAIDLQENGYDEKYSEELNKIIKKISPDSYVRNLFKEDSREFSNGLSIKITKNKGKANGLASENLEEILRGIDKKDLTGVGLAVIEQKFGGLKESYQGDKASTYADITKLHQKVREMSRVLQEQDFGEMTKVVEKLYEGEYSKPEEKETLEFIKELIKTGKGLVAMRYSKMFETNRDSYENKINENLVPYVAENLKDKDFVKFYEILEDAKKQSKGKTE